MTNDRINKKDLLKPENMVRMYANGAFPMADKNGVLEWYMPEIRTIIPLDNFNIPRSLKKFMNNCNFEYRFSLDPLEVIKRCAEREETWISGELIEAYKGLINRGNLHSVEVYQDKILLGGLYGVTFRGAFYGESMFSNVSQASKTALVKLVERLNEKGFELLDVQFITEHLMMFGAVEISFEEFMKRQIKAQYKDVYFL
ncbi:MAG: leucyl/phenylalanyl-tRNA--protein transferase [Ignavibacteria bacterium]|jgi:leucyl/phenylalanyl-tRNA--protein transferase